MGKHTRRISYLMICEECFQMFEGTKSSQKYCSNNCRNYAYLKRRITVRTCEQCGNEFESYNDVRFCSPTCVGKHQTQQAIENNYYNAPREIFPTKRSRREWLRRKRIREQWVEDVKIEVLIERDKGICQLCKKPVRLDVPYTHPLAPTRDHIIPINKGGEHSYANCQLACRDCNTIKNDRLEVNLIDKTKQKRKSSSSTVANKRRNRQPN